LILIPLKKAYGNQISEQIRCQKLSRTESRLTKASIASYQRDNLPTGICETKSIPRGADSPESAGLLGSVTGFMSDDGIGIVLIFCSAKTQFLLASGPIVYSTRSVIVKIQTIP
jgi:hypothetical protein